MSNRSTSRRARGGTVVGRTEWRHVGSVRGNPRPAGAIFGWARLLAGGSALAFVAVASAVVATPAAVANHDSVKELCGRNYTVDRQHLGIRKNVTGRLLGRLVLVKNRRSHTYCAVVILRHHKRKRFARVEISRTGPNGTCTVGGNDCSSKKEAGRFRRYAGPLAMTKRDRGCIMASGFIGGAEIPLGLQAGNCF
jgi:hypothetical protein